MSSWYLSDGAHPHLFYLVRFLLTVPTCLGGSGRDVSQKQPALQFLYWVFADVGESQLKEKKKRGGGGYRTKIATISPGLRILPPRTDRTSKTCKISAMFAFLVPQTPSFLSWVGQSHTLKNSTSQRGFFVETSGPTKRRAPIFIEWKGAYPFLAMGGISFSIRRCRITGPEVSSSIGLRAWRRFLGSLQPQCCAG